MLKHVSPEQVQMGMYVQGFDGSWWNHPFWRTRFVIDDSDDLQRIRDAQVSAVIIDTDKGRDIVPAPTPGPTTIGNERSSRVAEARKEISRGAVSAAAATYLNENARASKIVERSKRVVRSIFEDARLGKAVRTGDVMPVVSEIAGSLERSPKALLGVIRLKSKDEYTCLHSVAVCVLMVNFARHLQLPEKQIRDLGMAGLLHDVGKMGVPQEVLNKPGQLDDEEFAIIREHPERGYAMLSAGNGIPAEALDVCRHHHEKLDGTGYPYGLKEEELSLAARMGAICDVYDALTSNRIYKQAWSPMDSVAAMLGWEGHFDPRLLFAFMQSISVFPTGMLVRLRSNRLGVVLENGRRISRPRVKAFYDARGREMLKPETVVIDDSLVHDQIISTEDPRHWRLDNWAELQVDLLRDS